MSRARRTLLVLAAAILVGVGGFVAWLAVRDPIAALPRAGGPARLFVTEQATRENGRLLQRYVLREDALGEIRLVVSFPDPLPQRPLPVLVVVGGLGAAVKTARYIPPSGDNILVVYEWPIPRKLPKGLALTRVAFDYYGRLLAAPGQVAAVIEWLAARPWADAGRVSLLGFSLGALAAPAVQRLSQAAGRRIGWTVIAYGGADLGALVAGHPYLRPDWFKPLAAQAVRLLLRPVEPAEHLPHLSGRFLILGGGEDEFIPRRSARLLRDLTPEPKTFVELAGDHIGVGADQVARLHEIVRVTGRWLAEAGAVNPP
ncbi:MAG: alpha/beta hydrolase family protein [Kiloniellaceae bacterium]